MRLSLIDPPKVYVSADLGSSASKFFYRLHLEQTAPIWVGAEVVEGLAPEILNGFNAGGRPQDNAWLEVDGNVVMVGEAAKAFLDSNSLSANKAEKAVYKLAAVLGVLAELEQLPSRYEATIWLSLPLAEIKTRHEISAKLVALCQRGFTFRGKAQQPTVNLKCFPEGFGLYLHRKQQLERLGEKIALRPTSIVMMGHRNLSILSFENGSLNLAGSASDGPGFWPIFEKAARSAGMTAPDYPALLRALSSGDAEQISPARASVFDFSVAMAAVQSAYGQAVTVYLRDNLLGRVLEGSADILISGGAFPMIRAQLEGFFEEIHCRERVTFTEGDDDTLTDVVRDLPESYQLSTLSIRMMDGYGLFLGLIGKLPSTAASR
ncbi:MAG: hypothetical protein F6K00_12485 [Leptolyngbya sp. SIOISBB]|nr:hypothetical protein [Leptolyngbya sp. SIOISBB]